MNLGLPQNFELKNPTGVALGLAHFVAGTLRWQSWHKMLDTTVVTLASIILKLSSVSPSSWFSSTLPLSSAPCSSASDYSCSLFSSSPSSSYVVIIIVFVMFHEPLLSKVGAPRSVENVQISAWFIIQCIYIIIYIHTKVGWNLSAIESIPHPVPSSNFEGTP